jgi:hypothetical protein
METKGETKLRIVIFDTAVDTNGVNSAIAIDDLRSKYRCMKRLIGDSITIVAMYKR